MLAMLRRKASRKHFYYLKAYQLSFIRFFRQFITELANCDKVVVAAIFGFVGDFVSEFRRISIFFASDTSTFGFTYNALGQTTEGATQIGTQYCGVPRAVVLIFKECNFKISYIRYIFCFKIELSLSEWWESSYQVETVIATLPKCQQIQDRYSDSVGIFYCLNVCKII